MDKGVLEREKALKVKGIVSHNKLMRQHRRLLRKQQHLRQRLEQLPVRNASSLDLPPSIPINGTLLIQGGTASQDHNQLHVNEGHISIFNEEVWSGYFYNTIVPAESFFNQEGSIPMPSQHLSDPAAGTKEVDIESNSASYGPSEGVSVSPPTSPSVCEDSSRTGIGVSGDFSFEVNVEALVPLCEKKSDASYYNKQLSIQSTAGNQAGSSPFLPNNSSSTSRTWEYHASWPAGVSESVLCGDMEDALFMHYLDQIFYIQYPFYHSSSQHRRGWLFSILRRVKSAYHATLALSEYHQLSTLPRERSGSISLNRLQTKGRHYDLALREMQFSLSQSHTWSGTSGLIRNIETLTCILQLLFLEVRLVSPSTILNADNLPKSCSVAVDIIGKCTLVQQQP